MPQFPQARGDVWDALNGTGLRKVNYAGVRPPGQTDDIRRGYERGSRWFFGDHQWLCRSSAIGSAVWVRDDAAAAQQAAGVTPETFGAVGDGSGNDTAAVAQAFGHPASHSTGGAYRISSITLEDIDGWAFRGASRPSRIVNATPEAPENLLNWYSGTGIMLDGLAVDHGKSSGQSGHCIVMRDCDDTFIRNVRVDGVSGTGTGIIHYTTGGGRSVRNRVSDSDVYGDRAGAQNTNGILLADAHWGAIRGCYTEGIGEFPQEFKGDTQYSLISDAQISDCRTGLYNGSTSDQHPSRNVHNGAIIRGANFGVSTGFGEANLYSAMLVDPTGSDYAAPEGIRFDGSASAADLMTVGSVPMFEAARYNAAALNNFARLFAHHTREALINLRPGAMRNVTEVAHPGHRNSLLGGAISASLYPSVYGAGVGTANPVFCPATGEFLGSISGTFKFLLGMAEGVSGRDQDCWLFSRGNAPSNIAILGGPTTEHGFIVRTQNTTASLIWNGAVNQWRFFTSLTPGSAHVRLGANALTPNGDGLLDLGTGGLRWGTAFVVLVDYGGNVRDTAGDGSPEGVVTAAVGSTYRRRDGDAGTTFYVKESGVDNLGWVAK